MVIRRSLSRYLVKLAAQREEHYYDKCRSRLRERFSGKVRIYGDNIFANEVTEALSKLELAYPYGFGLVQRYIRGVVQVDRPTKIGQFIGVLFQQAPDGKPLGDSSRFAARLVRAAATTRRIIGFNAPRDARSELISLNLELHAMRRLQCDSKYFHHQLNQILKRERQLHNPNIQNRGDRE